MQVNLGRSNKFTKYDEISRQFSCVAELVDEVDIGEHSVLISAFFERNNEVVTFYESFNIIVYKNDFVGPTGPDGEPPIGTLLPTWGDGIRTNLKPEIKDETTNKPIPFIARLTETGLLTIGWDRQMKPPLDYEIIPDKKVAIYDISLFDKKDRNERLKFGWFKQDGDI